MRRRDLVCATVMYGDCKVSGDVQRQDKTFQAPFHSSCVLLSKNLSSKHPKYPKHPCELECVCSVCIQCISRSHSHMSHMSHIQNAVEEDRRGVEVKVYTVYRVYLRHLRGWNWHSTGRMPKRTSSFLIFLIRLEISRILLFFLFLFALSKLRSSFVLFMGSLDTIPWRRLLVLHCS